MATGFALKFNLRRVFSKHARAELADFAAKIAALPRPLQGGRAGGTLPARIKRLKVRFKRWGYVIPYASLGQVLTWLVRGTVRQQARPAEPSTPIDDVERDSLDAIYDQLREWDDRLAA